MAQITAAERTEYKGEQARNIVMEVAAEAETILNSLVYVSSFTQGTGTYDRFEWDDGRGWFEILRDARRPQALAQQVMRIAERNVWNRYNREYR